MIKILREDLQHKYELEQEDKNIDSKFMQINEAYLEEVKKMIKMDEERKEK